MATRSTRRSPAREPAAAPTRSRTGALARGLLVGEVALAAALLAGAAQLVRTFVNLTHADRGLNAEGVITGWVSLPDFAFKDRAGRLAFAAAARGAPAQMPGVQQVRLSDGVPPGAGTIYFGDDPIRSGRRAGVVGRVEHLPGEPAVLRAVRHPAARGADVLVPSSPDEVIVGERLAAKLWPGRRRRSAVRSCSEEKTTFRVVGVVAEIRNPVARSAAWTVPEMYLPLVVERDGRVEAAAFGSGQILARAALRHRRARGSDASAATIRAISAQVDRQRLGPMEGGVSQGTRAPARRRGAGARSSRPSRCCVAPAACSAC